MSSDRIRRLRIEGDALKRERIRRMSPGERMEEAFRLFRLAKRKR